MVKKILILFLLVFPLVPAQTDQRLFLSESLILDMELSSEIDIIKTPSSSIDYVSAEFNFKPEPDYRQELLSLKTEPSAKNKTDHYYFRWEKPVQNKLYYNVFARIKTKNDYKKINKKITFPINQENQELKKYTIASDKIDITPEIIDVSTSLAEGEDDLFEVVFKLGEWTNENIEYSLSTITSKASQKASWVLENRQGVCDEITNLFIAMCRSLKIPARFISGISYTNSELFEETWGLHGWAEVYFQNYGWVPFDVTYGQMGFVDSTHIKLKDSIDSDKSSTRFEWKGRNINIKTNPLKTSVNVFHVGSLPDSNLDISLDFLNKKIGFGSYNFVEATIKNKQNHYLSTDLALSKTSEIILSDKPTKLVLLKPGEEKKIYWKFKVPDNLKDNYIYTFPFILITSTNQSAEKTLSSDKNSVKFKSSEINNILEKKIGEESKSYSKNIELKCDAPSFAYLNNIFKIDCIMENTGNTNLKNIDVCTGKNCIRTDLLISQQQKVNFETKKNSTGSFAITISAENKDITKTKIINIRIEDKPNISIENLKYPENVSYEENFNIYFELYKNSLSNPVSVNVDFIYGNEKQSWQIGKLTAKKPFSITLPGSLLDIKKNKFEIRINYEDRLNNKFQTKNSFYIQLKNPGFWQKIEIYFNNLSRWIEQQISN
ncbi:hypothetical protein GF327_05770 [Candidatus Woesearchaeota archaeon]|nr:hypothetical protein [Candidatus Woesearchaeota archaeon]